MWKQDYSGRPGASQDDRAGCVWGVGLRNMIATVCGGIADGHPLARSLLPRSELGDFLDAKQDWRLQTDWKRTLDWARLAKVNLLTPEGDQAMNQTNEAFRLGGILG